MKRSHQATSSKVEELAKEMRLAALDGYKILTGPELLELRQDLQKLYFNAGRWAGGSRDWQAREAHTQLQSLLNK